MTKTVTPLEEELAEVFLQHFSAYFFFFF